VNHIQRFRRLAAVLAGLAGALLAFAAAAPASLAMVAPRPGGPAATAVPLQFLPPAGTSTRPCRLGTGPGRCTRSQSTLSSRAACPAGRSP
jgi:hypothetical protein